MRGLVLALTAAALLSACATPPAVPRTTVAASEQAVLLSAPELSRFEIDGRLQVRDGEKTAALGIVWQHAEAGDEWLFSGPLGQGVARIQSAAEGARMTLSDGRRFEAASAAALAERLFEVRAPFDQLPRWVSARLPAGAEIREMDASGRPLLVVDQGWTIEYLEYGDEGAADLPRKIDIHRGETRLRLIIDVWNP